MIKFGSARIDENGNARGGRLGDNNGQEVMIQPAYTHKYGWRIIRAKDPQLATAIALLMIVVCQNDNVGYDQSNRYAIFLSDLGCPTECDCSSLIAWIIKRLGVNVDINGFYTGNEVERLVNTGQFDTMWCDSLDSLCVGDILVDGKGTAHTVVVVSGNSRSASGDETPHPILSIGSQGEEVRKLQRFFNNYCGADLVIDGDYGSNTAFAVVCFQKAWNINVDGIYGQQTYDYVCGVLFYQACLRKAA